MSTSTLPPAPAPRLVRNAISRRVRLTDTAANFFIRAGGVGIIIIVALIFVFLGIETLPLFRGATQKVVFETKLALRPTDGVLALGIDEYETHWYYLDPAGMVRFVDTAAGQPDLEFPLPSLGSSRVTAAYRLPARDKLVIGTADGRLLLAEARFAVTYNDQAQRRVKPGLNEIGKLAAVETSAIT